MEIIFSHTVRLIAGATVSCVQGTTCDTGLPQVTANTANLQTILQLIFGALAIIAVIIIVVWGGLRFITDGNNPQQVIKARNTIIYATVGLAVAISGEVVVSFVLGRV